MIALWLSLAPPEHVQVRDDTVVTLGRPGEGGAVLHDGSGSEALALEAFRGVLRRSEGLTEAGQQVCVVEEPRYEGTRIEGKDGSQLTGCYMVWH